MENKQGVASSRVVVVRCDDDGEGGCSSPVKRPPLWKNNRQTTAQRHMTVRTVGRSCCPPRHRWRMMMTLDAKYTHTHTEYSTLQWAHIIRRALHIPSQKDKFTLATCVQFWIYNQQQRNAWCRWGTYILCSHVPSLLGANNAPPTRFCRYSTAAINKRFVSFRYVGEGRLW